MQKNISVLPFFLVTTILWAIMPLNLHANNSDLIISSYPIDGQFNFHINDKRDAKGEFQLNDKSKDFASIRDMRNFVVTFYTKDGNSQGVLTKFNYMDNKIIFDLPIAFLQTQTYYRFELKANEKMLYIGYFRTSKYGTFSEKVKGKTLNLSRTKNSGTFQIDEPLDEIELKGLNGKGTVSASSNLAEQVYIYIYVNKERSEFPYYFLTPKFQNMDNLAKEALAPMEKDNTLDDPSTYNMNKNELFFNKSKFTDFSKIDAKYKFPMPTLAYDSIRIEQDIKGLNVTAKEFNKNPKTIKNEANLTLYFDMPNIWSAYLTKLKAAVDLRAKDRGEYIYKNLLHRANRELKPLEHNVEYYIKQQKDNYPKVMQEILNYETEFKYPDEPNEWSVSLQWKMPGEKYCNSTTSIIKVYVD